MKIPYSAVTDSREQCFKKFGNVFDLPIMQSPNVIFHELNTHNASILDFGCGRDMPFKEVVDSSPRTNKYFSLDSDPDAKTDFSHLDEIPKDLKFDFIIANQVFEHFSTAEDLASLLTQAHSILQAGGTWIVTVPNIQHPVRFWTVDHKLPLGYADLSAFFTVCGYDVTACCRYSKKSPSTWLDKFLAKRMEKIYRIDWADSICVVATLRKKND